MARLFRVADRTKTKLWTIRLY